MTIGYWAAKDEIVVIHRGRIVGVVPFGRGYAYWYRRIRTPKTLIVLGEL